MASKTVAEKPSTSNTVRSPCKPTTLPIPKPTKCESISPMQKSDNEITQRSITKEVLDDKKKDPIEPLQDKFSSMVVKSLDMKGSSSPSDDTNETSQVNGSTKLEINADQEKKNSARSSVKDSSASAKVSDGSLTKTSGSAKMSDRVDFVDSGKSSMCCPSTSSDISEESTSSSISNSISKPHKGNDSRWEAIQAVRAKDGVVGLSHFRLLKRLGCGDIGSVYLSELSGTKCFFAMKVMDKASLAGRKKLLRAQTEREILQSLDHPFLPTLYSHFETDKFSCLVMEFCPGGDLHTLRQKQPGKHFSEQAVKWKVSNQSGGSSCRMALLGWLVICAKLSRS